MIERMDGIFDEPTHLGDLMDTLLKEAANPPNNPIRAIHFGTRNELDEVRRRKDIEERLKEVEARLARLEPPPPSIIITPTEADKARLGLLAR